MTCLPRRLGGNRSLFFITFLLRPRAHMDIQHYDARHRFECPICFKWFTTQNAMNQVRPFLVVSRCSTYTYQRFVSTAKQTIAIVVPIVRTSSRPKWGGLKYVLPSLCLEVAAKFDDPPSIISQGTTSLVLNVPRDSQQLQNS